MAWTKLRQFSWTTTTGADGEPEVDEIKQVADPVRLPVEISDLILTNALATTVSRPTLYDATLHELRLLGSYLHQAPYEQLRLRDESYRASALHIRRFVAESVGLGMLTASVQAAYRWYGRGRVHNVDALPTSLAGTYRGPGARPDLLFDTPAIRLAGEARGRARNPPELPTQPPRKRLNELLPWVATHAHNLVMTWTYLTGDGITVDWFFEDGRGLPDLVDPIGVPMPDQSSYPADLVETLTPGIGGTGAKRSPGAQVSYTDEQWGRWFERTGPASLLFRARRAAEEVERRLFATAPTGAPMRVAGRRLRGQSVPLNLVGSTTGSLLFGVFDQPLSQGAGWELTDGLRRLIRRRTENRMADDRVDDLPPEPLAAATIRGRLLVAVGTVGFAELRELLAD